MPELILKIPPLQVSDRNPKWEEGSGEPKILRTTYWEVGDRLELPEDRAKQLVDTGVCDYANPPKLPSPVETVEPEPVVDPEPEEQSQAEEPPGGATVAINQLPVNDASVTLLNNLNVRGLGKATAEALLVQRPEGGYESLEHLIGLNTLGQIKPSDLAEHITFE